LSYFFYFSKFMTPSSTSLAPLAISTSTQTPLLQQYQQVRALSEALCAPLEIEDYGIQSMADVSPPKWHLAHTTWFFETFLLTPFLPGYEVFHPRFGYLFNSYYETVGDRHPRPQRGLLSRPTVEEVYQYRAYVDEAMAALLQDLPHPDQVLPLLILGLHHEQQHQELLVTDIKHILACNPLHPAYHAPPADPVGAAPAPQKWIEFAGGMHRLGYEGSDFCFDNETPAHPVYLQDYCLASRLITNGEYLEFIQAGGYTQAEHWLADGWATVQAHQWRAPLYWHNLDGEWWVMTLHGLQPLNLDEPVCHVSLYEADAFARWAGHRLPTEAEWEVAAAGLEMQGNFLVGDRLHPRPAQGHPGLNQMFGEVWEWTQSAYLPYPGFQPAPGAVGEYNGKFMSSQMVLRGGSCATPPGHLRSTYRNFFPPTTRWQFSGIRLATVAPTVR
jgi:ergothioneine biosynthesis protein EgtB